MAGPAPAISAEFTGPGPVVWKQFLRARNFLAMTGFFVKTPPRHVRAFSLWSLMQENPYQKKRWNVSTSQPYRLSAQNRARPGRAGGLSLSVRAGAACHNCFASNARKPVDERASNRALKQIGFKLLPPEQSGRSNSPVLRVCSPTPVGRAALIAQHGILPEATFQC